MEWAHVLYLHGCVCRRHGRAALETIENPGRNRRAVRISTLATQIYTKSWFKSLRLRMDSRKPPTLRACGPGATLPLVIVDLNGCFAAGQAYVALSRATPWAREPPQHKSGFRSI